MENKGIIYDKIKNDGRRKLFILLLRFIKDTNNMYFMYQQKNIVYKTLISILNKTYINCTSLINFIPYILNKNTTLTDWETFLVKQTLNITRTDFITKFLHKNNIIDNFNKNLKMQINQKYEDIPLHNFINNAFIWSRTKEGYDFWQNIDIEFNIYLQQEINNKYN